LDEQFFTHEFDNGLTLVAQRMPQVSSSALTCAVPAGASHDPSGAAGAASVGRSWLFRGAGDRDTRALHDALDALGCQHHESVRSSHLLLSASMLGMNLSEALGLYADILRRPRLPEEGFEPCRDLAAQALEALEDEPMQLCNLLIREKFYPPPLGRNPLGRAEALATIRADGLGEHLRRHLTPVGTILAVAGAFDWNVLRQVVGDLLADWRGEPAPAVATGTAAGGRTHVTKPTAQAQITLAYAAPTAADPGYYAARVGQMVLSGGMSSRLFTEVREKRSLVYAVQARYHSLKTRAGIFVYAGTTPARAAETTEVVVGELRKLPEGVGEDELARARTQLKSALVMQGESTSARADALAQDWHHLRRLRSLSEIAGAIDAVTVEDVLEGARSHPAEELTMLTIGPEPIGGGAGA